MLTCSWLLAEQVGSFPTTSQPFLLDLHAARLHETILVGATPHVSSPNGEDLCFKATLVPLDTMIE